MIGMGASRRPALVTACAARLASSITVGHDLGLGRHTVNLAHLGAHLRLHG